MKSFKVYKNIRRKAHIMGMPTGNFWLMLAFCIGFFLILTTGLSVLKILFVFAGWGLSYFFAKVVFNQERNSGFRINDYKRN
mgnify:CR=1|jgi:hypothetical protein